MKVWWTRLVLNFLGSPALFGVQRIGLALLIIVLMLVAILAFIALFWRGIGLQRAYLHLMRRGSRFASLLNASILFLNDL
jgi:tryptophan-rich sensory protein